MVSLLQRVPFSNAKKEPKGFAPPFGASPRLGMPSLRSCSVGPPPSAIHGRGRLTRHPCRVAHCAEPAFGLWERGRQIKFKSQSQCNCKNQQLRWFASESGGSVNTFIGIRTHEEPGRPVGRLACFCGVRPLERPSGGSAQWATRHGCRVSRARPWRADRGGPTEQDRSEGTLSLSEGPNESGKSVWLLCAFQSDPL
jgi:hypothetical protein